MTGKHDIEVYNNKVHYFLTVKRNITILQGDSATGKTELIRLIQEAETNGQSSGISVKCSKSCTVLTPVDWELRLSSLCDHIVFIDETASFIRSKRFAELVRGSDNYFVIVTRDALSQLSYSIDEIYGLRRSNDSQKYKTYRRIYNEMYRIYNPDILSIDEIGKVITEDSCSGFELYSLLYGSICESAGGKSKVYDLIHKYRSENTVVIVDGAAFGAEIGKIMRYIETNDIHCVLYAPESFEYVLLCAALIDIPDEILEKTWLYADSIKYMSWEEFFTAYLIERTQDTIFRYGKQKLAAAYKTAGSLLKIAMVLPEQIRPKREYSDPQEQL